MKTKLLFVLLLVYSMGFGQIISQYVETNAGADPKGIEIWNNTSGTLNFATNNLVIEQGTNGAAAVPILTVSTGTLAAGAVMVIGTSNIGTYLTGQGLTSVAFVTYAFTFNGDDALVVKYGATTTDILGQVGTDPGSSWSGSGVSTANQNIALISSISSGSLVNYSDPSTRFSTISTLPSTLPAGLAGFGVPPVASCTDPVLAFSVTTVNKLDTDSNFTEIATTNSAGSVTYSSSNPSVAAANATTGEIDVIAAGSTTITASQVANGTFCADTATYTLNVTSTAPTISPTGTLTAMTSTYGTASTNQCFTFTGSNLTGSAVTVTVPSGFEVATSSGGSYAASQTYSITSGSASGTVCVRLANNTAASTYSGNVTLTAGVASATRAIPTSTVNPKALTITGLSATTKVYDGNNSVVVTGTPSYNGLVAPDSFLVSGSVTWTFSTPNVGASVTRTGTYNVPSTNYTVTQPSLSAAITRKPLSVTAPTIASKVYNNSAVSGNVTVGTLSGFINPETVTATATGLYADANVGTGKTATVTYLLANGTNGGLAANYSLANGIGTGDITKANPVFSSLTININIGGSQTIPSSISTSDGALSFASVNPAIAAVGALSGLVTGIAVGTTTINVSQASSANYNAGSTAVTVNVTTISYVSGDFRSTGVTGLSFNSGWEYFNGTSWGAPPAGKGPQDTSVPIGTVYINHYVDGGANASHEYDCNFIIGAGGELAVYDVEPTVSTFVNSNKKLEVLSGGIFTVGGEISLWNSTSQLIVRNGGEMILDYGELVNNSFLWDGTELFEEGSTVTIKDWGWIYNVTVSTMFQPTATDISNNANGYKFGNLIFDIDYNLPNEWTIIGGTSFPNLKLCENNLEIYYTGTVHYLTATSNNSSSFIVNGDVIIYDGAFYFSTTFSGSTTFTNNFTINGDLINISNDAFKLHHRAAGSSTPAGTITVNGNVQIGENVIFSNNGNKKLILNQGTFLSPKTIDIAAPVIQVITDIESGYRLLKKDLTLGTNSGVVVKSGSIFDFGFATDNITALSVLRNGTQNGMTFTAEAGATLKITSPFGITDAAASAISGNVQTPVLGRTFDAGATYHYIGKVNQVSGNGLPNAAANKHIIVELETDNLEFTSNNGIIRFNNPSTAIGTIFRGLEIRKGTVVANDTGSRFDDGATGEVGNLKMSGGIYKIFTRDVQPAFNGIYDLSSGSKIIFAHTTTAATTQGIRGGESYQYPAIEVEGRDVRYSNIGINMKSNGLFTVKENAILTNTGNVGQIVSLDDANPATLTVKNTAVFKTEKERGFSGVPDGIIAAPSVRTSHTSGNVIVVLESGSTVDYSRTGNQTITVQGGIVENTADTGDDNSNYSNLKLSGSGTKSFAGTALKVGNDLEVADTSLLPVLGTQTLIVNKKITTIPSDNTKGIFIEDNGSLVQIANVDNNTGNLNTGDIRMQRKTKPLFRFDYTYWSSPVQDFILKSVSPTTLFDKFFRWNETTQAWFMHSGNANPLHVMEEGRGYIVRAPQGFPTEVPLTGSALVYTANFVGKPNNGVVNHPVSGSTVVGSERWNLLGNPYPSAIDATAFLNFNAPASNPTLGGTLYFWTHNTSINSNSPNYSPNDYASWNGTGSTATLAGADGAVGEINGSIPTGNIAAGQGFFVKGLANGVATFNNGMRIAGQNNQFFKGFITEEQTTNTTPLQKHRVWLNLKGPIKGFNQLLVGYIENATNDFDNRFDGESFGGNLVTFYSINNTKNLVIQGRALPFINQDTVPLGYKTTLTGNLTISIDHVDGLMEDQDIYLQDNLFNVVHDLKASSYTFASVPGTFNTRFVLRYLPQENLSNPTFDDQIKAVRIYKNDATLYVSSPYETIATVSVYDLAGRLVFERKNCNTNRFETNELLSVDQALIVKVTLSNGGVVTEKVAP